MKEKDYVRTKWGYICKIVNVNEFREPSMKYGVDASYLKDVMFIGDEDIIKSSPNIIDLLEKSDLVVDYTGDIYKVDYIYDGYVFTTFIGEDGITKTLTNYQIKSIVTKEQFESMEYKAGE